MMPCNLCSPADENGIHQPFGSEGQMLLGLKQRGKTKYLPDGMSYQRTYVCQDCGAEWKMIGKLGPNPSYKDIPILEIVRR